MATIAEIIAEIDDGIIENTDELITGQIMHDILIDIAEYLEDNVPLTYENGLTETAGVVQIGGVLTEEETNIDADGNIFTITGANNITLAAISESGSEGFTSINPNQILLEVENLVFTLKSQLILAADYLILGYTDDNAFFTGITCDDDGFHIETKNANKATLSNENITQARKYTFIDEDGVIPVLDGGGNLVFAIGSFGVVPSPDGTLWKIKPNNDGQPDFEIYIP